MLYGMLRIKMTDDRQMTSADTPQNPLRAFAIVLFLSLFAACSTNKPLLIVDYDHAADFSRLKTYRWYDDVYESRDANYRQYNSSDKRVRNHVDQELRNRGFVETYDSPDFIVNYSISREEKREVSNIANYPPAGVHGGATAGTYGAGASLSYSSGPSVKTYREGTFVLDVIDTRDDRIVWRGLAEGRFTKKLSLGEKEQLAAEISAELLADFPPQAK